MQHPASLTLGLAPCEAGRQSEGQQANKRGSFNVDISVVLSNRKFNLDSQRNASSVSRQARGGVRVGSPSD